MPSHRPPRSGRRRLPAGPARTAPLVALLALLALAAAPRAQDPDAEAAPARAPLVVATKQAPPFSFRGPDGRWRGLSIELWESVAAELGLQHEYVEASLDDLVTGLTDGRFDASVAALTVTPEREARVDFSHPYLPSGLGIAVPARGDGGLLATLRQLLSLGFLQAVGTLLVVLFLGGAVLWLIERRRNPEQFGGSVRAGLGNGFWWSAVTMTTVGYGDKAPVTPLGRVVAVIWMFASVITISGLTAAIASTLTVSRLDSPVSGPDDLGAAGRVGCVRDATGEAWLREERLPVTTFDDVPAALQALADGRVGAVVHDAPMLRHQASTRFADAVAVLPATFERQDYAFALPLDSPLRKDVNTALLARLGGPAWQELLYEYLGARP